MRDVCQLAVPHYMMADFVIQWNVFVVFTFTFAWSFSQLDSSPVLYCQPEKHPYLVCHSSPTKCDNKYRSKHNHSRHNHGAPTTLKAFHTEGKLRHFGTWGLQHPGILVEWENGRHENLTDFRISAKIQSPTSIYSIGDELVCVILDRELNWKNSGLQAKYSVEIWPVPEELTVDIEVCAVFPSALRCSVIEYRAEKKKKKNVPSAEWTTPITHRIVPSHNKHNVLISFRKAPHAFAAYNVSLLRVEDWDFEIVSTVLVPSISEKIEVNFKRNCPGRYKIWVEPMGTGHGVRCACVNRYGGCETHCTTSATEVFTIKGKNNTCDVQGRAEAVYWEDGPILPECDVTTGSKPTLAAP